MLRYGTLWVEARGWGNHHGRRNSHDRILVRAEGALEVQGNSTPSSLAGKPLLGVREVPSFTSGLPPPQIFVSSLLMILEGH